MAARAPHAEAGPLIREQRLSVLLRWPSSWRAVKRAAGRVFLTAPAACAACTAGGNGRRLGTARCRTDARSVSMKVLVTGGTGFVGSHSVKAMLDAGHDVRLLVRSSGRVAPALEPLGVSGVDHVVGDATDAESVRRAMDGCNAVLHAAAVFSYDARDARAMQRVNTRATRRCSALRATRGSTRSCTSRAMWRCCHRLGCSMAIRRSVARAAFTRVRRPKPSRWRGSFRVTARQS